MLNRICVLALLVAITACGGSSNSSPTSVPPTVSSIAITTTASIATVAVGQTIQLTATATLSNGSSQNVSTQVTWQSSNQMVATVSGTGLVTSVTVGTATITATYQGKTATIVISVLSVGPPAANCKSGSMSATINGVPWTADCIAVPFNVPTYLEIAGVKTAPSLSIAIALGSLAPNPGMGDIGPGTFGLGDNLNAVVTNGTVAWQALPSSQGGAGPLTFTINTLTATSTSGTFLFTAPPQTGGSASGTQVVINGVFNITF
jgi:hypothetical protein